MLRACKLEGCFSASFVTVYLEPIHYFMASEETCGRLEAGAIVSLKHYRNQRIVAVVRLWVELMQSAYPLNNGHDCRRRSLGDSQRYWIRQFG